MKFFHTADWHLGKTVNGFSMLADQQYFLEGLLSLITTERPDALLIAGDIYDRPVPSGEAVGVLNRFLSEVVLHLHIPILMIAGNHDSKDRLSFGSDLLAQSGLYIAGNLTKLPQKVTFSDSFGTANVYLLPYLDMATVNSLYPDDRTKFPQEAFDRATAPIWEEFSETERNILLCHGFFCCTKDVKTQAAEIDLGGSDLIDLSAFQAFDYVAAGHIHRAQNFSNNMRYSGSILKYSLKEAAHKLSVTVIELKEKGNVCVEKKEIPLLHDLKILQGSFDSFLQKENPDTDYIFAVLEDRDIVLNAASRLREKYPNLMGISYANRISETLSLKSAKETQGKSLPTLFSEFYKSITDEPLDLRQQEYVEALTKALES